MLLNLNATQWHTCGIAIFSTAISVWLVGCGGGAASSGSAPSVEFPAPQPPLSAKAQVGERLYSDRFMSGSGRMSCVNCHNPDTRHGPPNGLAVQVGGAMETEFGTRASPSIRYLHTVPAFSVGDGSPDQLRAGLMADGRANNHLEQVHLPLFGFREMDNGSIQSLADRLRKAPYAAQLSGAFGDLSDDAKTVHFAEEALAAFQREDARMHPFSAKIDAYRAGLTTLSAPEQRGLAVFRDPAQGNCSQCHVGNLDVVGDKAAASNPPLFTHFGYAALGLPRNPDIPANSDPGYFDMGVCGPNRTDLTQSQYCGLFRVPTLRNVAERPVFFHNGVFKSLAQAVRFYATRDSKPADWYPLAGTTVDVFNDLPAPLRSNVTRQAPFGTSSPRLDAQAQADLVCFLETLSDGFQLGDRPRSACQ